MKITKRQLRRVIRQSMLSEIHPRAVADNAYMDVLEAVDELLALRSKPTFTKGAEEDELYIMTGAAEGITVKVLRRGR